MAEFVTSALIDFDARVFDSRLNSAMNYRGFTFPLWGFLANTDISYDPQQIDAQTCMAWMDNYRAGLSHQQQLRMFNQLDSHDTARFKTLLGRDIARLPLAVVWSPDSRAAASFSRAAFAPAT